MMNTSIDIVGIRLIKEREILSEHCIKTPKDAVEILANELKYLDREMMMSINLNNKNEIINAHIVSVGTINASLIDPKNIFKAALLSNATSIVLIHNHPSGDCNPSREDIAITDALIKAGEILEMKILDHIVIGSDYAYSIVGQSKFEYEKTMNISDRIKQAQQAKVINEHRQKICVKNEIIK